MKKIMVALIIIMLVGQRLFPLHEGKFAGCWSPLWLSASLFGMSLGLSYTTQLPGPYDRLIIVGTATGVGLLGGFLWAGLTGCFDREAYRDAFDHDSDVESGAYFDSRHLSKLSITQYDFNTIGGPALSLHLSEKMFQ